MRAAIDCQAFMLGDRLVLPGENTIGHRAADQSAQVHVSPRAMQLLLALSSHPDAVVAREQLKQEVWGEQEVADDTLNHCVSDLRRALDDDPRHPRFIETLPHKGYRLLAHPHEISERRLESSQEHAVVRQSAADGDPGLKSAASLVSELRRRKVFRIAMAYAIVAWGLVQTLDVVWPHLPLPDWPLTVLIIVAVLGFPIALILAWALEITPRGLVLDMPLRESHVASAELSRRSIDFVIIGALLIVVCLQTYLLLREEPGVRSVAGRASVSSPLTAAASVAVLPFTVLGEFRQGDMLGDGLANELVTMLSGIDGLQVVSPTSSFAYRGAELPIREIGSRLGVASILEGSVRLDNGMVHVDARLVDAQTQFNLWSQSFVRPLPQIFSVQSDIAEAVMRILDQRAGIVRQPDIIGLARAPTGSIEAYTLFLQASSLLPRRDRELVLKSISAFSKAIALDRQFARAHAGLAAAKRLAAFHGWLPREAALSEAAESARLAISLNPQLAEAHVVLADLQSHAGHFREAEQGFRMAISRDQKSVLAHHWFAVFLLEHGRFEEALAHARSAHRIDPASPAVNGTLAHIHSSLGNPAEAEKFWEQARDFGLSTENYLFGVQLALLGKQPQRAAERWKAYLAEHRLDDPASLNGLADLIDAFAAGRQRRVEASFVERLDARSVVLALVLAGDAGRAAAEIGRLVEGGQASLGVVWSPLFADVRRHEAFAGWLQESGHLAYWRSNAMPDMCGFANGVLSCR